MELRLQSIRRLACFLSLAIVLSSCQRNEKYELLLEYLDEKGYEITGDKAVFVIPLEGCAPCIENTIKYARITDNENIIFILQTLGSEKNLRMRYPEAESQNNVIIDHNDELVKNGLAMTSPVLYLLEEDEFKEFPINNGNVEQVIATMEKVILE